MIRAKELGGRAVIDVDAAEKLGRVDRIVLDPESRRVAGFVVARGSNIFNNDKDILLPASCVHAVGPDAITVHRGDMGDDASLAGLPRVSDITGRKVVSDTGRLLGTVDDVLIDESDGRIIGYALEEHGMDDRLRHLFKGEGRESPRHPYLRADADLRTGENLIVAPESAVSFGWDAAPVGAEPVATAGASRWTTVTPVSDDASAGWVRGEGSLPALDRREGF